MSTSIKRRQKDLLATSCATDDQLASWVELFTELKIPRQRVCPHHNSPFDYLRHTYFEPTRDCVVWAPRGGGKTRLAALATLLDLLHKPGCSVRILGGSKDQSMRMWEHLFPDLTRLAEDKLDNKSRSATRVALSNGSTAAVLTQSQRAVRGLRVQKLRCDEVELFKPEIWEAAQLVTKSRPGASGAIEAISTFHQPWGLMSRIVESARARDVKVYQWCTLDVLERCPPERPCEGCPLWDECKGIAKTKCAGFVSIDDAVAMKGRVSKSTWESEMLCLRPKIDGSVFPMFDPGLHVRAEIENASASEICLAIDFGFAAPFVCLWLRSFEDGTTHAIDEYVQSGVQVERHIEQIQSRSRGSVARLSCDPAGAGRNDQTAASNVALLRQHGFNVKFRKSRIVEGLELIRAALLPAMGEPKLFFHPRCTRLIRAMQAYHFPPGGGELPEKDGVHDHLIDALRYHFVNRPTREDGPPRRY
jgi:hypothetical protein